MLKVALTGGIATGKSYVLAKLRDRGAATIDADDIVHAELGPGTPTTKTIAKQFGSALLKPDGSIDRGLLGTRVFGDPATRLAIEAIIHPVVYEKIRKWFATLDRPIGVASIPLLFETGREGDFDFVVVTASTLEQQLERLVQRDRMTEEEAKQRIAAQMPSDEKAKRANYVIMTGGSKLATDKQVEELLGQLLQLKTRN
jgi:dephospho-CoA kinase